MPLDINQIFRYTTTPHRRRHGPQGYERYESFKPWLRDEFAFRCVYCQTRERWSQEGAARFSVEHLIPRTIDPGLVYTYDNLLYTCVRCNAFKGEHPGVLDPCRTALGDHLHFDPEGLVIP